MPISDGPQFSVDYISNVEKIAVARNALIVGKTQTGYFILDTDSETLRSFGSVQDFNIGATAAGIDDSQLQNPDDLAAKLTNRAIRPWEYHAMNGLFWLTDYTWGDICVYAGFLLSVVAGLMIPRIREWENQWNARIMALCFGVFLGWVVNTVGIDWMSDDANGAMLMGPVLAAVLGIAAMFCGDLLYWIDKAICRIFRVEQLNGTHRGNHTGHA
jgi:hypothetical protein